jgi:serine protease Do
MRLASHIALLMLVVPPIVTAQSNLGVGSDSRSNAGPNQAPSSTALRDFDLSIDEVAERVAPSIVQVLVSGLGSSRQRGDGVLERQKGIGSGVIVDPTGYIMTNAHVVVGARRIRVLLTPITTELVPGKTIFSRPPRTFEATLVGTNRFTDLALLKIDAKDLPYVQLKESFRARLGQTVLAIGSPEGLTHTVTMGIVSAPGRQPDLDQPMVYVQTDAAINPGNSGGALVDREGNLVGINTFIYSRSGGSEGLGFAIPQPTVRFVYEELKQHGHVRRNVIGANAQTITPTLAAGLKLDSQWGVIISDVLPNGPAEKHGLLARDIVTAIDGVPIDSLPKFTARLYLHPHDRPVSLTVQRAGKQMELSIVSVDAPSGVENLSDLVDPQNSLVSQLGLFFLDLDKLPENTLPEMRSSAGVIVVGKVDYIPAIETSLTVGDVIQSVNGSAVRGAGDLRSQLSRFQPGDAVVLRVERQGMYQFVCFEME